MLDREDTAHAANSPSAISIQPAGTDGADVRGGRGGSAWVLHDALAGRPAAGPARGNADGISGAAFINDALKRVLVVDAAGLIKRNGEAACAARLQSGWLCPREKVRENRDGIKGKRTPQTARRGRIVANPCYPRSAAQRH